MGINPIPGTKKLVADVRIGPKRQGFKRPRRRKVFPNSEAGRDQATLWIAAQLGRRPEDPDDFFGRSFDDAYDFYIVRSKFTSLIEHTQSKNRYRLSEFVNFATSRGKLFLHEFSQKDAEAYAAFVMKHYSGKGREARLLLASDFFRVEIDRDGSVLTRNPFRSVKKSGYDTVNDIEYLEEDIVYEILRLAQRREALIIMILYSTGMRVQELEQLLKKNVRPDRTIIERKPTAQGPTWRPKMDKEAVIPHDKTTWNAYQELYNINPAGDWVLCGDRAAGKGYLDAMCKRMRKRFTKEAPHIPHFTPHSFRRSLGTHLAERGVRAEIVQKILRHTDLKTTLKYYVKITPQLVRDGIAPIQAPLRKISRQLKISGSKR